MKRETDKTDPDDNVDRSTVVGITALKTDHINNTEANKVLVTGLSSTQLVFHFCRP